MTNIVSLVQKWQQQRVAGKSNEEIISFLSAEGCSEAELILIVASAFCVGLNDAKEIVHGGRASFRPQEKGGRSTFNYRKDFQGNDNYWMIDGGFRLGRRDGV